MGNDLLSFGVLGAAAAFVVAFAVFAAVAFAAKAVSTGVERGWRSAVEFGEKVQRAIGERNWEPACLRV